MMKEWSVLSIVLRLLFSVIIGTVIGIDRSMKRRGAGIKTHVLVCMGATLVMITGQFIQLNYEGNMDVARLGAQVISGVGFLGVGTIVITGHNQVRGLTTAAGLWLCACVGLALGIGFMEGVITSLILTVFTFKILTKVDQWMIKYATILDLYVEFETNKGVSLLVNELHKREIPINSFEIGKSKIKGEGPNAIISIEVKHQKERDSIMSQLRGMNYVKYMEELRLKMKSRGKPLP